MGLMRDVSNHCPIVLKMGVQEWGPKPFRFNNCWLSHKGFEKLVVDNWAKVMIGRWKAIILKEKWKDLKAEVRKWNVEIFVNINNKIKELEHSISDLV